MSDTNECPEDAIALDLNNPKDARTFIEKAMSKATGMVLLYIDLEDGRRLYIKEMTDEEAVHYAWEMLPVYQQTFPDLCEEKEKMEPVGFKVVFTDDPTGNVH